MQARELKRRLISGVFRCVLLRVFPLPFLLFSVFVFAGESGVSPLCCLPIPTEVPWVAFMLAGGMSVLFGLSVLKYAVKVVPKKIQVTL